MLTTGQPAGSLDERYLKGSGGCIRNAVLGKVMGGFAVVVLGTFEDRNRSKIHINHRVARTAVTFARKPANHLEKENIQRNREPAKLLQLRLVVILDVVFRQPLQQLGGLLVHHILAAGAAPPATTLISRREFGLRNRAAEKDIPMSECQGNSGKGETVDDISAGERVKGGGRDSQRYVRISGMFASLSISDGTP